MNRNILIISSLFLILPISIFVSKISAQVTLPQVTNVCEGKHGELYSYNDRFSKYTECEGKRRKVLILGEEGDKGDIRVAPINGLSIITSDLYFFYSL